ncbi:hypothetical protein ASZ78_003894 [Callipepla squamata]|uniref:Uncharacterized protein n=1 Tax=Callipepla squamata TaxID=9009 RepID=A0A226MLD2_CALSU|nr:hypothetical protein ASZ78_003894 [Callipepla squamata]
MLAPGVPDVSRDEAPVAANTQPRAAMLPETPKDCRTVMPAATKALNLSDFMRVQALPAPAEREGKVLARSWEIYRSSGPPREQVFWEQCCRRERQRTQGLFTLPGKPYQEQGELCTDPKKLTLRTLGQLAQSDPLESEKRLTSLRETGKDLKTLSKTLAHLRHHINIVKRGGEYFHVLHQESLERKNTLKAQKSQVRRWTMDFQPCKYLSDAEESVEEKKIFSPTEGSHPNKSGKKKKMSLRSFTPIYASVLIPRPSEAQSECLFRQLCAIHWLLEASTLESSSSMQSILSCWNLTDPGGFKKSVKEAEEEKLATYMWELFITNTKKYMRKARRSPFRKKTNKTTAPANSQLSSQSSHCQTPLSSVNSLVLCSEDHVNLSGALANVMSASIQAKERQFSPFPQKQIHTTHVKVSKDVHEQEDMLKKAGQQSCHISHFIKSKSNLCADARHKFMAIREEAAHCLHDALESLERFPALLARLPEPVKNDHYVKKILKKLEKFGMAPDLHIQQETFLKALTDLQVWELCSPEIAAAVEVDSPFNTLEIETPRAQAI